MAKLKRIFFLSCASTVATTAMTVFSYGMSGLCRRNFREPRLLAAVSRERWPQANRRAHRATGWLTHYVVGVIWALLYAVCSKRLSTSARTTVLGASSGMVAAGAWKLTLNKHPQTARRVVPAFFAQLIPAHLVFNMVLAACEKRSERHRNLR